MGDRAFSGSWRFVAAARKTEQLPPVTGIEVGFAGRSNVGKSSLINGLTRQGALARTSHTPGRTQEIIFFESPALPGLRVVDLPGYGYARVSRSTKREWGRLVQDYLLGRSGLARVYLLIDGRRGIGTQDREVMQAFDTSAVSYQVVVTKTDKLTQEEIDSLKNSLDAKLRSHPAAFPEVLLSSSRRGTGMDSLRQALLTLYDESGIGRETETRHQGQEVNHASLS